ncbi:cobalamin-dependent protein [Streptomyces sp. NBC_01264]|uniref:cobalamin-dependent protein n=1 Tax=Streptomyces sp. NBC_01264 TaxID=2903804 RepID=UPI002256C5A9|nr:cobalamin-dependent protein [Streptomyces sp. NBC_01264]MCX4778550.1 cobalamin-dependent protein [Streptomyces sp. NBC_01264]
MSIGEGRAFRCLLTTVESDSHFWNLIYLEKFIAENGGEVRNLGGCTPADLVVKEVNEFQPDLLVVSSVNGHGYYGTSVVLTELKRAGISVPCVAGGKLTTAPSDNDRVRRELLSQGCTDVFLGEDAIDRFREFMAFGIRYGFAAWQPSMPVVAPWDGRVASLSVAQ